MQRMIRTLRMAMAVVMLGSMASCAAAQGSYPDKPIIIDEVGWPSYGRTRHAAVASPACSSCSLAMPKSSTSSRPSLVRNKFAGFKSR